MIGKDQRICDGSHAEVEIEESSDIQDRAAWNRHVVAGHGRIFLCRRLYRRLWRLSYGLRRFDRRLWLGLSSRRLGSWATAGRAPAPCFQLSNTRLLRVYLIGQDLNLPERLFQLSFGIGRRILRHRSLEYKQTHTCSQGSLQKHHHCKTRGGSFPFFSFFFVFPSRSLLYAQGFQRRN